MPDNNAPADQTLVGRIRSSTLARMADVPFRKQGTEVEIASYTGPERRRAARSPMADSQRKIAGIDFPPPDHLPSTAAILADLPDEIRTFCATELGRARPRYKRVHEALASHIAAWKPAPHIDIAAMVAGGEHANLEVHDQFFAIRRVPHSFPAAYLQAIFRTLHILQSDLEETPTTLDAAKIAALARGMTAALEAALGLPDISAPFSWTPAQTPRHEDYPVRRWIRGHQIFTSLTQALTFAFDAMDHAAGSGDDAALFSAADLVATAMQACAHALEFTGDFPPQVYQTLIRTSMVSPFQPEGFSGLLSEDHRHLVKRMKLTRSTMDLLKERSPERQAAIVRALGNVYDSHKFVCGRFVGADKPSLLMVRETGRSAIDQLDRFKTARLRSVGADHSVGADQMETGA